MCIFGFSESLLEDWVYQVKKRLRCIFVYNIRRYVDGRLCFPRCLKCSHRRYRINNVIIIKVLISFSYSFITNPT